MAEAGRRPRPHLIDRLESEPGRFSFFQVVRLILRAAETNRSTDSRSLNLPGTASPPDAEPIRFTSMLSMGFPGSEVTSVRRESARGKRQFYGVSVTFFGLLGATGVMPSHYTRLAIERSRRGDTAFKDFLDLFTHRALSLFYRAWEKVSLAPAYERSQSSTAAQEDLLTQAMYSLVGLGNAALAPLEPKTSVLRGRLSFDDETLLYYAGHFSHRPRTAEGLSRVLNDFTGLPAQVQQYRGQWLSLRPEDQSSIPSRMNPLGQNCQLGTNVVIGSKVWTGESRFRIRFGPLALHDFDALLPGNGRLKQVSELAAVYAGVEYDFDVQPVLRANCIPEMALTGTAQLGWSTWLVSRPPKKDGDESVLRPEGLLAAF